MSKYSPEATELARLAHDNRVKQGHCRPVKPVRTRIKYAAGPNSSSGYTNPYGVPDGALNSASRTGLESNPAGPKFEKPDNSDINSGAFGRLQAQIGRTDQQIQAGQARRG